MEGGGGGGGGKKGKTDEDILWVDTIGGDTTNGGKTKGDRQPVDFSGTDWVERAEVTFRNGGRLAAS